MAPRIALALAIHNHQPVGNFGWVIADVYDHAYRPMLDALERHPTVSLSLHYTGPLLEWMREERPDFLERLGSLVARGQVELLGGGYYEPVLASLPERDRVGQLTRMADELQALTGTRPRGAWLAERVWEPDLPTSLVAAGYGWTILDDAHFRAASIPDEQLWGAFTTEDQGHLLTVFATGQRLRHVIPFGRVRDAIAYLRDHATEDGSRVGMMGDDGEKFGAWPTTWEHCWGRGRWIEDFFEALEANRDWLSTVTPSAWLEREPPIGRVYVPTSSYAEMGEWALPAGETLEYARVLEAAATAGRPEARWLRGGFWRNFQVKYREVNDLHKQMLRTSAKVEAMTAGPLRERALDHLYRGQSNDCYWHGLFGGIYIAHMRLATYEHLIAAEDLADEAAGCWTRGGADDLDLDGRPEILLATPGQVVTIKPDEGGGIGAWDIRAARHALASVMRRRPEAYHATLREHEAREARAAERAAAGNQEAPASIHELVRTKEAGLSRLLRYDDHERRSGLVHLRPASAAGAEIGARDAAEFGDFVDGPFEVVELVDGRVRLGRDGTLSGPAGPQSIRVETTIDVGGGRLDPVLGFVVRATNLSADRIDARLVVEWNVMLLGGGGNPAAWYDIGGERSAHDGLGAAEGLARFRQGNDHIGLSVTTTVDPPADVTWEPIETISNSESGFERVYQGSALLISWPLRLEPGEQHTARIDHAVRVARDRTTERVDPLRVPDPTRP